MNKKGIFGIIVGIVVLGMLSGCIEEQSVVTTEPISPLYYTGDVINAGYPGATLAILVLDYRNETDEYLLVGIREDVGIWQELVDVENDYFHDRVFYDRDWYDREYTEENNPLKIGQANLSIVMTYEEYEEYYNYGGGRLIHQRYYLEKEGGVPKNYYETGDSLIDDVEEQNMDSLKDAMRIIWLPAYEEDEFMCGHASAYLEWYLESMGFDTDIIVGDIDTWYATPFSTHGWIRVDLPEEGYVAIEATELCEGEVNYKIRGIITEKGFGYYAGKSYDDIYDLLYHESDDSVKWWETSHLSFPGN